MAQPKGLTIRSGNASKSAGLKAWIRGIVYLHGCNDLYIDNRSAG
jgi:hypothetical protein